MKYHFYTTVRDKNGNVIQENGHSLLGYWSEHEAASDDHARWHAKTILQHLSAWMPENEITIQAFYHDEVSDTICIAFGWKTKNRMYGKTI